MNNKLAIACLAVIVIAGLLPPLASAQTSRPGDTPAPQPGERRGGAMLQRVHDMVNDLSLSDEQKTKIDGVFEDAQKEIGSMAQELRQMDPQERGQRMRDFLTDLRKQVNDQLNDQQRAKFEEKLDQLRGRFRDAFAGGGGGAGGAGATTMPAAGEGRGAMILRRLEEAVGKLELSDAQKQVIKGFVDDTRSKMRDVRAKVEAGATMDEVRDQARKIITDLRDNVAKSLTPEQRAKFRSDMDGIFRDALGGGPGAGGAGADRPRARREREGSPTTAPSRGDLKAPEEKKDMSGDEQKTGDSPRSEMKPDPAGGETMMATTRGSAAAASSNAARSASSQPGRADASATPPPDVGAAAPNFSLEKLDGRPVQLSSSKGRVLVLLFGSYSSPSFRQRAAAMHQLSLDVGNRAQFLVVYTKEAHPSDGWQVDRNRDDHIEIAEHKSIADRKAAAKQARDKLHITFPLVVDGMDDSTANAYGAGESSAVVIGRDGTIVARQTWSDPSGLRRIIDQAALVTR